jgi:choline monooxygenase
MSSPLTPDDRSRLASEVENGFSLPASWYTDPAILALEQERVFRRTWQYVGRTEQLAAVGDYVTGFAGDVPVVVVRGEQGLKAFVNVCRHRRHLVMDGCGNRKALLCPYHAWSYDLNGCLKAAPRAEREEGFNFADYPLLPLRVDTWERFVFVNADPAAPPVAHYFGEVSRLIARSGLDLAQLRFQNRSEWRSDANWKTMLENYLECYHCPVAHPGFSSVIDVDPDAYALRSFEWFSSQTAPVLAGAPGEKSKKAAYDTRGEVVQAQYYYLWPNMTVNIHPGHPNLSIGVWLPDGPSGTRGFTDQFFGPEVPEEFVKQLREFVREVVAEDNALTISVQCGLQSGLPERGRLLARSEQLIVHFQRLVVRALAG